MVLYGHHLFLLDKSYYYFYKRQQHQLMEKKKNFNRYMNIETNKRNHNWFSATTGGIHLQQQKIFYNKKKKEWQYVNYSTPNLTPSSTAVVNNSSVIDPTSAPYPDLLINAKYLINLSSIANIQPMIQEDATSNVFQIHIKDQADILYYEAPNTQIMLEWVALINTKLKMDPGSLLGHYSGFKAYQSQPENVKDILVKKQSLKK